MTLYRFFGAKTETEFLDLLIDYSRKKLVSKRCSQQYLEKHHLYDYLLEISKDIGIENPSIIERITYIRTGKQNFCSVCNNRTRLNDNGSFFKRYCSRDCYLQSEESKERVKKHNEKQQKVFISREELETLYWKENLSLVDIGKRFGVSNVSIKGRMEKFGISFRSHSENQKKQASKEKNKKRRQEFCERKYPFDREKYNLDYIIEQNKTRTIVDIAKEIGCSESHIEHLLRDNGFFAKKHYISQYEIKVQNLLKNYDISFIPWNKDIIYPYELDIFIPSNNIAIEVNGIYWHSEKNGKGKNYHLDKLNFCEEKNIHLFHFWDNEIRDNWEIVSSIIKYKLNLVKDRISARKCEIKVVFKDQERDFLENNHLQGYRPSSKALGIYYKNEIISIMTFGKPRFNKKFDWELIRFCNKKDIIVQGGASRLFSIRPEGSIISYSNKRYSAGNLYRQLGFSFSHSSDPDYFYTRDYIELYHRSHFQKHKLKKLLNNFDSYLTEWENMMANGYDRIWDCGNDVWIIK